jgi:hypothetical protein
LKKDIVSYFNLNFIIGQTCRSAKLREAVRSGSAARVAPAAATGC